jgi:hypothetical protein
VIFRVRNVEKLVEYPRRWARSIIEEEYSDKLIEAPKKQ